MNPYLPINTGWICPFCGAVVSLHYATCPNMHQTVQPYQPLPAYPNWPQPYTPSIPGPWFAPIVTCSAGAC